MSAQDNTENIETIELFNDNLEYTIKDLKISPSMKCMNHFINELVSTSLIVLISDFIHSGTEAFDEEGYFSPEQYDTIPLIKFKNDEGFYVFPVFTSANYVESIPYFEGCIPLIVPAIHVLEMAQKLTCEKIVINLESSICLELDTVLIDSIVFRLISEGVISTHNTFI